VLDEDGFYALLEKHTVKEGEDTVESPAAPSPAKPAVKKVKTDDSWMPQRKKTTPATPQQNSSAGALKKGDKPMKSDPASTSRSSGGKGRVGVAVWVIDYVICVYVFPWTRSDYVIRVYVFAWTGIDYVICVYVFAWTGNDYVICVYVFAWTGNDYVICVYMFSSTGNDYVICVYVFAWTGNNYVICVYVFAWTGSNYVICVYVFDW
ncbi:hypothetical protein SARC_16223, partial [Sphaeroforma arctica JP610]